MYVCEYLKIVLICNEIQISWVAVGLKLAPLMALPSLYMADAFNFEISKSTEENMDRNLSLILTEIEIIFDMK